MRIQRYPRRRSGLSFGRRRRPGCFSTAMLIGALIGTGALSLNWLQTLFDPPDSGQAAATTALNDLIRAAWESFGRGDLEMAITHARQAVSLNPASPLAVNVLTRALIYRSYSDYDRGIDRETALQIAADAARFAPDQPDIGAAYAFALGAAGQPVESARIAERILESAPDHALARTAMALAYGSVGSLDVALRESDRAARLPPSAYTMDALRALAIAQSDLGRYADAGATVAQAIQINPRVLLLYFEQALYALQLGDTDAATVAYFEVLAVDPANAKARLRLCELSSLLREHDAAVSYCEQVTTLAPAWSEGWFRLGREYFVMGDFALAQSHLNRCSSLQVMQAVPVAERRFECWYLQGQAAEIRGDCAALTATYNEFREMASAADIEGTWMYPPEGPTGCR